MPDESMLSRRDMMALAGTAALLPLISACRRGTPTTSGTPLADLEEPLIYSSVSSLAQAIQAKQISSAELVRAYLDRIEDVNPALNAVVQLAPSAMDEARDADAALARGDIRGSLR